MPQLSEAAELSSALAQGYASPHPQGKTTVVAVDVVVLTREN